MITKKRTINKKSLKTKRKPITRKKVKSKKINVKKIIKKKSKKNTNKTKHILKDKKTFIPNPNNIKEVKNFLLKENFSHHLANHKKGFLKNLFSGSGFYKFVWFSIIILLFVNFFDFLMQFLIHTNFTPRVILMSKSYLTYTIFSMFMVFASLIAYSYMGYEGAKHNFRFNRVFTTVLNIVILFTILEIILTFIGYFTFMQSYLSFFYDTTTTRFSYLLYLLVWIIIKAIISLFVTAFSYLISHKFKHLKYN